MNVRFIRVDDREPRKIDEMLVRNNITPVRYKMDEGDYVYKGVVVERKEINDFCGSICDGRLKKQIEKMERFEIKVVVVVGDWSGITSGIHRHSVLGMMSSMVMRDVKVCFVESDEDFCYLLRRICERYDLTLII